jgi:hypothetical protein
MGIMKRSLNLLPESYRRRVAARRLLHRWVWTAVLSGCGFALYVSHQHQITRSDFERLKVAQSKARPYIEMTEGAERLIKEIETIRANDALVDRLTDERSPIVPIAVVSQAARACTGRVWVRRLSFESTLPAEPASNAKPAPRPQGNPLTQTESTQAGERMTLDGFGVDNLSVAEFVAALRQTEAFQAIELKSSVTTPIRNTTAWAFSIEGEL